MKYRDLEKLLDDFSNIFYLIERPTWEKFLASYDVDIDEITWTHRDTFLGFVNEDELRDLQIPFDEVEDFLDNLSVGVIAGSDLEHSIEIGLY